MDCFGQMGVCHTAKKPKRINITNKIWDLITPTQKTFDFSSTKSVKHKIIVAVRSYFKPIEVK